jgi:predicted DNA-binding protein (UPF0251 family)
MVGYRWGWRRGGPGRPMKPRVVGTEPSIIRFVPIIPPDKVENYRKEPIIMTPDELEALRLVDYLGLMQEEAAKRMGVSRGTVWRCLDSARRKVATMLVEGREITISTLA